MLTIIYVIFYYLIGSYQLRKVVFAIKNSTTVVLPQWFSVLRELNVTQKMIPCDVRTQWNSTFNMLDFAVKHITAINTITGDHNMKLRQCEDDWDMAHQLPDLLKVHSHTIQFYYTINLNHFACRFSRT